MPHDQRIAQLTGQPFGVAYFEGLLRDNGAVMDSAPPTTAILAAEALAGHGLDMIAALQRAHYVAGLRIAEVDVLVEAAAEVGLDRVAFRDAFDRLAGASTEQHIGQNRKLLAEVGGQGFPTFALEDGGGAFANLDIGPWLGRAADWQGYLAKRVAPAATANGFGRGSDPARIE